MTRPRRSRLLRRIGALLALVAAVAGPAVAQEAAVWDAGAAAPAAAVTFERVGTFSDPSGAGLDPEALAFDSSGALYLGRGTYIARLSPDGVWVDVNSRNPGSAHLLALGLDTLLVDKQYGLVQRSLDGGRTWAEVHRPSGALYLTPRGLVLSGERSIIGIARSTDRGGSFDTVAFPATDSSHFAQVTEDFLALPEGHPHAGRLLMAGLYGVALSDDDGRTWRPSSLWQEYRYIAYSLAVTPGGRVLVTLQDALRPGYPLFASDDGGATWTYRGTFVDPPGEGREAHTRLIGDRFGHPLADGSLLVLTGRGRLWRTRDEGETWVYEGAMPAQTPGASVIYAPTVGPDGRLYASVSGPGGWVWRTVEAVVGAAVSSAAGPAESPGGMSLSVRPNPTSGRAEVVLSLAKAQSVRVAVLDVRGREVAVLLAGSAAAGERRLGVDTSAWPAGVYVIRVTTESGITSTRLVVAR